MDAAGEGYTLITQAKSSHMDWDIDSKGYASRYQFRNLWKKVDGVKEVQVFEDKRLPGYPLWYISAIEFEDYTWEVYGKADLDKEQFLDNQQRVFVDSLGREVIVPQVIEKIIPSGMFAQEMISVLCPEKMMTVACEIDESEKEQYAEAGREKLCDLPETGEMYTMDGRDVDTEKIRKKSPDIVLDVGCLKDDLEFSLDYMQEKADTITIFIDGRFGKLPMAFRSLGELLDCQERAEELAVYIEGLYEDIEERKINLTSSPKILYAANELGLSKHTGYSFQNEVIRFLGGTPVEVGSGVQENTMDTDILSSTIIDYIIFNNAKCFEKIIQK